MHWNMIRFVFLTELEEQGFSGRFIIRAIDDQFVPQASVESALKHLGLDAGNISEVLRNALQD